MWRVLVLLSGSRADGPACLSSYSAISDELCHLKNIRVIDCLRAFGKWESGAPLVFSLALSASLSLSLSLSLCLILTPSGHHPHTSLSSFTCISLHSSIQTLKLPFFLFI